MMTASQLSVVPKTVWNTYETCAVVVCYDITVPYKGTNSEDNPFLFLGQFEMVHLGLWMSV
jgi:hypothetical protein